MLYNLLILCYSYFNILYLFEYKQKMRCVILKIIVVFFFGFLLILFFGIRNYPIWIWRWAGESTSLPTRGTANSDCQCRFKYTIYRFICLYMAVF